MYANFSIQNFINNAPEEFGIIALPTGELKIFIGPFEKHSHPEAGRNYLYFNNFFLSNPSPFLSSQYSYSISLEERGLIRPSNVATAPAINWSRDPQTNFLKTFSYFRELLLEKNVLKAVPISFCNGELIDQDLKQNNIAWLLNRLVNGQTGLHSYALKTKDFSFFGATPEILFSLDYQRSILNSEAVAGSIISSDPTLNEITGKLREEHELVVNDLEIQLSKLGRVRKAPVRLKSLNSLCHLRTPFEVELNSKLNFQSCISLLHPTGALGILPRVELNHPYIKGLDLTSSREYFGAPYGAIFENGDATALVAIRNLTIRENYIRIGAGAGITPQSEPNSELAEIIAKQNSVKSFFGLV